MTSAIILSAGQGRRLLPLTENCPKCLLKIGHKTVLEWQIETLLSAGIENIYVVAGFNIGKVEDHVSGKFAQHDSIQVIFNPFYEVSL